MDDAISNEKVWVMKYVIGLMSAFLVGYLAGTGTQQRVTNEWRNTCYAWKTNAVEATDFMKFWRNEAIQWKMALHECDESNRQLRNEIEKYIP